LQCTHPQHDQQQLLQQSYDPHVAWMLKHYGSAAPGAVSDHPGTVGSSLRQAQQQQQQQQHMVLPSTAVTAPAAAPCAAVTAAEAAAAAASAASGPRPVQWWLDAAATFGDVALLPEQGQQQGDAPAGGQAWQQQQQQQQMHSRAGSGSRDGSRGTTHNSR
jgi:hypothetical protein